MSESPRPPKFGLLLIESLVLVNILMVSMTHHFWATAPPTAPIFADGAGHMQRCAAQYSMLASGLTLREKLFGAAAWPRTYPPLVFDVGAVGGLVWGPGPSRALRANAVFLIFLGVGAWLVGRAAGGPLVGLAAACAVLADNAMLNAKLFYYLDMPMSTFMVLTLGLLPYTDGGARRAPTLAVGVTLALGFLCKFTMIFFLALPLLLWVALSLRQCEQRGRMTLRFALLIGLSGAIFVGLMSRTSMQTSDSSLETPLDARLIGTWWAWCLIAFVLAQRFLEPRVRNQAQALLISGVLVGPWVLVNSRFLMQRTSDMGRPGVSAMHKLLQAVVPFLDPGMLVLCAAGALAALLVRSKRASLFPVALSLCCVLYLNLYVLNCTMQSYYVPLAVLITLLGVAWVPRRLAPLALLVFGTLFCVRLLGPMYYADAISRSERPWLNRLVNFGRGIHAGGGPGYFAIDSAQEVLDRLPPTARTLVMATRPGGGEALTNGLSVLDMVSSWNGARVCVAHVHLGQDRGVSWADHSMVRYAMLARVAGEPPPDLRNHPPDAVLVLSAGGLSVEDVTAVWGDGYDRVETQVGPLLLRRGLATPRAPG